MTDDAEIEAIVEQSRDTYHVRKLRPPTRFSRALAFWAPRHFVNSVAIDVDGFIADLDNTIRARGMVLYDQQITTTLLEGATTIESIFERDNSVFPAPPRVDWGGDQRDYFQIDDPYQMAEDPREFTYSHLIVHVDEPFLRPGELIAALLHGDIDNSYFECECHTCEVVYTTQHRLLCMSCGFTHLVLADPLPLEPLRLLTAGEWIEYFDRDGSRRDETLEITVVDFRDVEHKAYIWSTDRWNACSREFVFFARSSEEEIWEAIRGTELDPTILMEAGWTKVESAPPPAFHIRDDAINVDTMQLAEFAFREGITAYFASDGDPKRLLSAVPELFRTVELLLKARLESVDDAALRDRPNNPTVIARLRDDHGVPLTGNEIETIRTLRELRNDLQHNAASFNNRRIRGVCRSTIVLVNRFIHDEFGEWVGDAVGGEAWWQLLSIPEVAATADLIVEERIGPARRDPQAEITDCLRCGHNTMIRPHPSTGASCAYCGFVPVRREG